MTNEHTGIDPEGWNDALSRLAETEHLLLALDFDGTLSPLINEPLEARMSSEARAAVEELLDAPDTTVALVSGRSMKDLRHIAEHSEDSRLLLAGSHGVEYWTPEAGYAELAGAADDIALRDQLYARARTEFADAAGVYVEPKTFGFGIHTRVADSETAERANTVVDALVSAQAPHWRRRTGHNIREFSFRHEGKDTAVSNLRESTGATAVLFAGDDVTDEDAFAHLGPDDVGIRVGAGPTAATMTVPGIPTLAAVLSAMATRRNSRRQ